MAQQPLQHKIAHFPNYRPIAPSTVPPQTLPHLESLRNEKRKWGDFDGSSNKMQRRGSGSSQGSNNSSPLAADQRIKRKEQNRAAQRAFRERKERYVKELEDKIKEIEAAHAVQVSQLEKEIASLKSAMSDMQKELGKTKGGPTAPPLGSSLNTSLPSSTAVSVTEGQSSPPYSDTQSPAVSAYSTPATSPVTATPRVASSAVACIRDKDGVSFCERLKEEVCSNAYDRLLTEPLFDAHGFLNETVASHPVPIVTTATKERSKADMFSELEQFLTENFASTSDSSNASNCSSTDLISCSEVWQRIAKHPQFDQFDTDELCNELRRRAKCSRTGPVFEEYEVQEVLDLMVNKLQESSNSPTVSQEKA